MSRRWVVATAAAITLDDVSAAATGLVDGGALLQIDGSVFQLVDESGAEVVSWWPSRRIECLATPIPGLDAGHPLVGGWLTEFSIPSGRRGLAQSVLGALAEACC